MGERKMNAGTYYQNEVFEPVEVIVHYNNLNANILKFKWNNKVYKVSAMPNKWTIPNGESKITHYTVICKDSDIIAELSFDHADMKWTLIQWDTTS
jgi:hypothetical protein